MYIIKTTFIAAVIVLGLFVIKGSEASATPTHNALLKVLKSQALNQHAVCATLGFVIGHVDSEKHLKKIVAALGQPTQDEVRTIGLLYGTIIKQAHAYTHNGMNIAQWAKEKFEINKCKMA